MTFSFAGTATVRHVNLRKEGATEAKSVMADIKLEAIADASILHPFNDALVSLLFNRAGEPRIVNLAPIHLDGSIKHLHCNFLEWKLDLRDIEAKKFQFEPMSGSRVLMTFSIAIAPHGQQTAMLAEMLGEAVKVTLGVESDLLAQEGDFSAAIKAMGVESSTGAGRIEPEVARLVRGRAIASNGGEHADVHQLAAAAQSMLDEMVTEDGTSATITGADDALLAAFGQAPQSDLERAIQLVREKNRVSPSLVQRHLKIGFTAATRLIETMQSCGIVSAPGLDGTRMCFGRRAEELPDIGAPTLKAKKPRAKKTSAPKPVGAETVGAEVDAAAEPGAAGRSIPAPDAHSGGEPPSGKVWTAEELLFRIPPAKDGHVLVLRAIGPAREEMIELRINALDDRGQRVQVGYQCNGKGTGTYTAPVTIRDRGMLEDAIHDALALIRDRYAWKHLADAAKGWPLSKVFRNIGVRNAN